MARTKDKPGTYRVSKNPDARGMYRLSGVRKDGSRFAMKVAKGEGDSLGRSIVGSYVPTTGPIVTPGVTSPHAQLPLDDYGMTIGADFKLPEVSDETIASSAPPHEETSSSLPTPEALKRASERTENAKSLAEMIGVGYAGGVALASRKFLEDRYEDVPRPSKKHLGDLADNIKLGFAEMFGDREIGPWTMVLLLTLGIPIAMWMQSGKAKPKEERSPLQSVP